MDHEIYQSKYYKFSKRIVQITLIFIIAATIFIMISHNVIFPENMGSGEGFLSNALLISFMWVGLFGAAWLSILGGHWVYWKKFLVIVIRDYGDVPDLMSFPHLAVAVISIIMIVGGLFMLLVFSYALTISTLWLIPRP